MLDTVRSCKNPNIVTIHGYYKATSQLWVVMEYCQAFSVHTLMEHFSRPLKETQIKTVLSHVLKGIVHNDNSYMIGVLQLMYDS